MEITFFQSKERGNESGAYVERRFSHSDERREAEIEKVSLPNYESNLNPPLTHL